MALRGVFDYPNYPDFGDWDLAQPAQVYVIDVR
jgi:hypothetical protein